MNGQSIKQQLLSVSLSSRGAKVQFAIGIALVLVIPFLALCYLYFFADSLPATRMIGLVVLLMVLACLGCVILAKYPRTIIRMRNHLYRIATGEVPDVVKLLEEETDIAAIEQSFNMILTQMKERVATIERQREELITAEQERVMTESLCTACHHLGQPATALTCCLDMLKRQPLSSRAREYVDLCVLEVDRIVHGEHGERLVACILRTGADREDGGLARAVVFGIHLQHQFAQAAFHLRHLNR